MTVFRSAIQRVLVENGCHAKVLMATGWLFIGAESLLLYLGHQHCDGSGAPVDNCWSAAKHRLALARYWCGRAIHELGLSRQQAELLTHVRMTHQPGLLNPERAKHPLSAERITLGARRHLGRAIREKFERWTAANAWRGAVEMIELELRFSQPLTDAQHNDLMVLIKREPAL